MDIDRDALVETFLLEAEENLAAAEDAAIALESSPDDEELVQALFRAIHTLKGSAGALGYDTMAAIAHALEDLLDDVRRGHVPVGAGPITIVLEAVDALRATVEGVRATGSDVVTMGATPRGAAPALAARIEDARQQARTQARGQGRGARGEAAPSDRRGSSDAPRALRRSGTVRVAMEKLDEALSTSGEITMALGRLEAHLALTAGGPLEDARQDLERLHRQLLDQVMALRMVPIGPMLRGFVRTVRDVAQIHGKQARLVVEGAEITVDANVIEALREPLTHIVRNALDHGIERPQERRALGKDPAGRILARAHRDAGALVVQIEDDGRGLRRDRLVARARALGLLASPEHASDADLFALVFTPGFSTAEQVTDLSGRGVGMDAVKRAVEALRGTVSLASGEGKGTAVTLRLPVSLALLDGFRVGLDDDVFVLPREAVRECVPLATPLGEGGTELVDVRGRTLPVVRLRALFERGRRSPSPQRQESLVVLDCGGAELGLAVDHLYGEAKTLIAPMNAVLRRARGVAGCTVLGSGRVALLLDVAGLFQEALRLGPARAGA